MKPNRHPHPHLDPRQPRHKTRPGTNPPVFAWKPPADAKTFTLTVAHDRRFENVVLQEELTEPTFLPDKALAPGKYYWQWASGDRAGEIFNFTILKKATTLEVPTATTWLERLGSAHPRLYVKPDQVTELRDACLKDRLPAWQELEPKAEVALRSSHEIEEPPVLADKSVDYQAFFDVWYRVMNESRRFVREAETLALAYLASGKEAYGRAACQRMASISRWDPHGSSHIHHNDEAHMSVIWDGCKVCDWVWELFTDEERARVIQQFRARGEITFDHMHNRGSYGVTRFDSHAGREIVFLALIAFVFHEHVPDARMWLDWLRPVLCGIWPIWAGDDGAWAEGPAYGLAYIQIMTMFATALKHGADVDLYQRSFWRGHCEWRQWCVPSYMEWMGFGDHTEVWGSTVTGIANLVDIIETQSGSSACRSYAAQLRERAPRCPTPGERAFNTTHLTATAQPITRTGSGIPSPTTVPRSPMRHSSCAPMNREARWSCLLRMTTSVHTLHAKLHSGARPLAIGSDQFVVAGA